jgi:hypothetical protein
VKSLDLSSSISPVAVGDKVTITATASDESTISGVDIGNRVAGVVVSFSTGAGQLSSETATTNGKGLASVTLTAPDTVGSTTISASAQGVPASLPVDFVSGPTSNLSLTASQTSLGLNRSVDLRAVASDGLNNPVAGLAVSLRVTGSASTGSFDDPSLITDDNGRASTTYTAGSAAGKDTLQAIANGVSSNMLTLTIDPNAVRLEDLALTTGNDEIVADGQTKTRARAIVTDTAGTPVQGIAVSFRATAGVLSAESATTDAQGVAQVQLTSQQKTATSTVTASVGGLNASRDVDFVVGPISPEKSSITANPTSLPSDGTSTTTVTVTLADKNGNAVADDTNVQLQASAGTVTSNNPATTKLGRTTFTLRAPTTVGEGTVKVGSLPALETAVRFGVIYSGAPANVQTTTDPKSIFVSGVGQSETSSITINVRDSSGKPINEAQYGNPGLDNVRVSLVSRPNGGEFLAGTNAAGNSVESVNERFIDIRSTNGTATVNLQSGTLPGIVEARVQVLDFDGNNFNNSGDVAATASLPQVTVASGPPNTLVFTQARKSITNEGGGIYSRLGTVIVTDRYGNTVPNGTAISLGLVDSVIAQGTGSITSDSPTLMAPLANSLITTRCDSSVSCKNADFDLNSTIQRNGAARGIEGNDRILLENGQSEDKGRFVAANSLSQNSIKGQADYLNDMTDARYTIGASLLGAEIGGIKEDDDVTTGSGVTKDGRVRFRVAYPANPETILVGCYGSNADGSYSTDDKRFKVPQSAQVLLVASASDSEATGLSRNQFCFQAIAGATLKATPTKVDSDATVTLELTDGGDDIALPFAPISATSIVTSRGDASNFDIKSVDIMDNAENGKPQTGINAAARAAIDINCDDDDVVCESGDSAVVTFRSLDATVEVTVSIP